MEALAFLLGLVFGGFVGATIITGESDVKQEECAKKHNVYTCEWVLEPVMELEDAQ